MPWTKRADREQQCAADARLRLREVQADTEPMRRQVERVHHEVKVNGFLQGVLELNQGRGSR
jgi:hypothetical protein